MTAIAVFLLGKSPTFSTLPLLCLAYTMYLVPILRLLLDLQGILPDVGKNRRPSAVYRLLESYPARVLAAAWVAADRKRMRERLLRYQTEWRLMETEITGNVLKAMGLKPSPLFGRLLGALRDARLDGRVSTREEEIKLLESLLDREERQGDREIGGG